ncbi:hypothetical protein CAPTEDRAFT_193482 [Capitella teleta]|uniref:Farnesoic acid O-methyl transferase domain-containing protein n=1 Tax=Capitella teleta TaxID=283909 RepID=R7U1T4_CAPTE|nr:hypothetical protein CAPTEDRAFT_193482 [Capitella teleta]|eukprot:ELT97145.1 hypothetical protein CAPTEDRAFT_193482 [Capitella teleta]
MHLLWLCLGSVLGDFTNIYTDNVHNYTKQGLSVFGKQSMVFRLKACSDGHIALIAAWGQHFNVTDIVIGCCSNTASMIRSGETQIHYADALTPEILHCGEFRTFWIHWGGGFILVGQGPVVGEQELMRARRVGTLDFPVVFASFSTGWGHTGVWQIPQNQGYFLYLYTPDDFKYNYAWRAIQESLSYFVFHVRACHDVHVNLSPTEGVVKYEIFIGGMENTKSVIRSGGEDRAEHHEEGLLHCDEYRHFWVAWFGGHIRVGSGSTLFRHQMLEWRDEAFVPRTSTTTTPLEMRPDLIQTANEISVPKKPRDIPGHVDFNMWAVTSDHYVYLRVRSCGDARIIISQTPGVDDDLSDQIYIGADGNTKTGVFTPYSPQPIIEVSTPNILHCNRFVGFYLFWEHRDGKTNIHFGQADDVHYTHIFNWTVSSDLSFVNGVGFGGEHAEFGIWRNTGTEMTIGTPIAQRFPVLIRSSQAFSFFFRVRSCRHVIILLTAVELHGIGDFYRVEIARHGNQLVIRDLLGSDLAATIIDELLSCETYRSFWIGWLDGVIRIGRGHKYGWGELLRYDTPIPHVIDTLSIHSAETAATWQFENDAVDTLHLHIIDPSDYKWLHLRYEHEYWFYFEVLGSEAKLILNKKYRDTSSAYSFIIGAELNTRCEFYKGTSLKQSIATPNVLDQTELSPFWVSFYKGNFALGRGKHRGGGQILEYQDAGDPEISAVGLSAVQSAFRSEWKMYEQFCCIASWQSGSIDTWASITAFNLMELVAGCNYMACLYNALRS